MEWWPQETTDTLICSGDGAEGSQHGPDTRVLRLPSGLGKKRDQAPKPTSTTLTL